MFRNMSSFFSLCLPLCLFFHLIDQETVYLFAIITSSRLCIKERFLSLFFITRVDVYSLIGSK